MDRLERLRLLADRLEGWLQNPESDRASVARQYRETLAEIDALEQRRRPAEEVTALDEVNARRKAKGAGRSRGA